MTRIIGGVAGGRRIAVPPRGTRPTTDRVRESLFNILTARRDLTGLAVLDLYAGAGLTTLPLADAVGEAGSVLAVEGDDRAVRDARRLLHDRPQVTLRTGDVGRVMAAGTGPVDLVVLDPPRTGAGRRVVAQVAQSAPDRVVYVACDPAALARDVALFAEAGYRLDRVQGYDLFPMTHHVEAVALLTR